jgi:hypothetical protein
VIFPASMEMDETALCFFFHLPSGARGIGVACSLSAVPFLGPKLGPIGSVFSAQTGVKLRPINESVDGSITQRSVVPTVAFHPSPNTPSTASLPPKRGKSVTYVSGTICYLCLGSLVFSSSNFRKTRNHPN